MTGQGHAEFGADQDESWVAEYYAEAVDASWVAEYYARADG